MTKVYDMKVNVLFPFKTNKEYSMILTGTVDYHDMRIPVGKCQVVYSNKHDKNDIYVIKGIVYQDNKNFKFQGNVEITHKNTVFYGEVDPEGYLNGKLTSDKGYTTFKKGIKNGLCHLNNTFIVFDNDQTVRKRIDGYNYTLEYEHCKYIYTKKNLLFISDYISDDTFECNGYTLQYDNNRLTFRGNIQKGMAQGYGESYKNVYNQIGIFENNKLVNGKIIINNPENYIITGLDTVGIESITIECSDFTEITDYYFKHKGLAIVTVYYEKGKESFERLCDNQGVLISMKLI